MMNRLLKSMLGLWLMLGMAAGYAADDGLDIARGIYMSAQANFIDSMANPEKIVGGGRNFVRYLAKIQAAKRQLDAAGAAYEVQLKQVLKNDERYDDREYREVAGLPEALADYDAISKEVGEAAMSEAAAAYADEFH